MDVLMRRLGVEVDRVVAEQFRHEATTQARDRGASRCWGHLEGIGDFAVRVAPQMHDEHASRARGQALQVIVDPIEVELMAVLLTGPGLLGDAGEMPGFGSYVKGLREARRLTQEELGERCGLAADTIRRLEHSDFSPSLRTLKKLVNGLDMQHVVHRVRTW